MAKIPDVSPDTWKNLYAAASEFAALKPWNLFDDNKLFGVHDPATGQMGYACVLGALGEVFALTVYRGAEGLDVHRRMQNNEFHRRPQELVAIQNCLMAEFADREDLEKADRSVIRKLGLSFRGPKEWPLFRSHLPSHAPWHLTQDEAAFLTLALHCGHDVASKVKAGQLDLAANPGQIFCCFPKGGEGNQTLETRWEPEPIHRPQPPEPLILNAESLARIKAMPLRADGIWEADISCLPAALTDRDRPYLPRAALVVHQDSGFILHSDITPPDSSAQQALAESLLQAIAQSGRLPNGIQLRDEAFAACLAPLGKALGIQLKSGKLKMVLEARKELEKFMRTGKLAALDAKPAGRDKLKPSKTRAAEKTLFDLGRAIRAQEFKSEDELDAWLEKIASHQDLKKAAPKDALEVAQSVMYEAWEAEDPDRAVELAERALTISPDCADAYNLLAENVGAVQQALDLLRKGVEAGQRALTPRFFEENAGHFWGMIETRPYMRCRANLAACLWELKRHEEALGHYYDMLRLNPGDNQGLRYVVLACLGELGRFDDMNKLIDRPEYQDGGDASWLYTKALLAFVQYGKCDMASAMLQDAMKRNKHVPAFLAGVRPIPRKLPDLITMGREDEACSYAGDFVDAWKRAPGALEWLKAEAEKALPAGTKEKGLRPQPVAATKPDEPTRPQAGRNEPCPCGSGKKFKKCCGQ